MHDDIMQEKVKQYDIVKCVDGIQKRKPDNIVIEEPLEIRVVTGPPDNRKGKGLSITMRTPGNDFELAPGFLFSEGIIHKKSDIESMEFCGPIDEDSQRQNTLRIHLSSELVFDPSQLQRHFYTTSSCGVCGKASLDALRNSNLNVVESEVQLSSQLICELPDRLLESQRVFSETGALHAVGLFSSDSELISVREDVGRHNAMDKVLGHQFLQDKTDLRENIVVVSGRASFELLQKSTSAQIPIFVAVGAPSSLAVDLANQFGVTLIGFASNGRFNIYSHAQRVV